MTSNQDWNVPSSGQRRRITLHDVARHVGVSKSTVSLVLQGNSGVSTKTRERILRGIEETGYVYNRKAAALRQTQQNDLIGVLVNDLKTPYSSEVLSQIEEYALLRNIVPMFASCTEKLAQQEKLVQLYMEHKVAGFILCPAPGTRPAWLDGIWRNGFPLVQIMREVPFCRLPSVVADNRAGTYAATQHLLQLGHERIAFLGGDEGISDYHERLAGYMDALNDAGVRVPDGYIYPVAQSRAAGREGLRSLLACDPKITALVCFSDLLAYGVLSMSHELGIKVGQDLAVVGFDDLADSRLTYPALTSVRVEAADFAQVAMELLQLYLQERQAPVERRVVPATLVIRESCGAPQSM